MLSYKVFSKLPRLGGVLVADWSLASRDLVIETTQRGFGTCTATIRLPSPNARWRYATIDGAYMVVAKHGGIVYEGRIEIVETVADGLAITAFGYSRAYSDLVFTDLWSSMTVSGWQPVDTNQIANRNAGRWTMDTNNRLYFAPNGGDAHDTSNVGSQTIAIPHGSTRQLVAISFDYSLAAPHSGWVAALDRWTDAYGYQSTVWTLTGNGAVQTGTVNLAIAACDRLLFNCYLARSTTTLGTAVVAGGVSGMICTPASMTGIVKGARLAIGGLEPEEIDVTAVTVSTFTADFRFAHLATDSVSVVWEGETGAINLAITNLRIKTTTSAAVYADEVVRALVAAVKATNPNQSNSQTPRIKSPGFDLKEFSYVGASAADVLDQLALIGGDGAVWSWRVWEDQIMIFDRIVNGGQVFQIRVGVEISRDLDALTTRLIPRYTDINNVQKVASAVINSAAEQRTGLIRTAYFNAPTSTAADATVLAQAALLDRSTVNAFGDIDVRELWQNGQRVPLTRIRSGDTIQVIAFPTTGNSETDKTRQFRVAVTRYAHETRTVTISPEQRAPTIDSLLARREVQYVGR